MPKQKTSRAAKKRFTITGAGRILRRHAMQSHNLEKKTSKRKRLFSRDEPVHGSDLREVRRLLGRRR